MAALHVVATPYAVAGSYTTLLDTTPGKRIVPLATLSGMYRLGVTDSTRLVLPLKHHAEAVFALIEAERDRFETWMPPIAQIRTMADQLAAYRDHWRGLADGTIYPYVIEVAGEVAGTVTLVVEPDDRRIDIGYWLASRYEGYGIVTRCVQVLIDTAIVDLGIYRFEIHCAPDNPRSSAVPRRLGFQYEGTLRGYVRAHDQPQDQQVYSLLAPDREQAEQSSSPA